MNLSIGSHTTGSTPQSFKNKNPPPFSSRRRDKPQLSCNLCRRRKLKCDRAQPCSTCELRGHSSLCAYASSTVEYRAQSKTAARADAQTRISQLEGLVWSLMEHQGHSVNSSSDFHVPTFSPSLPKFNDTARVEDSPELALNLGRITLDESGTSYVESSHWSAIISGIAELRDSIGESSPSLDDVPVVSSSSGPRASSLLRGHSRDFDRESILAAIPLRSLCDKLVSKYFRTMDASTIIIHAPTFFKQYEKFWADYSASSIIWLGSLFAMMCLGLQHQQFSPVSGAAPFPSGPEEAQHLIEVYREKTIQCLILGDYLHGGTQAVEALLLYMHIEYFQSEDTQVEVWVLFGVVVRLALRIGLHRDPSHFPSLSPFEAEIRRRVWAVIVQLDIVASTHFGLPRMIRETHSDTKAPRNLFDSDLEPDMPSEAPDRPPTTETHIQYFNIKNNLFGVYANIFDLLSSVQTPSYDDILRLDEALNNAYNTIPSVFMMRPIMESLRDSDDTVIGRLFIVILFRRSQCTLHRNYMALGLTDSRYSHSRKTCVEAALEILEYQYITDQETQPGGRFRDSAWRISLVVKQDYLLATTILCLALYQDLDLTSKASSSLSDVGQTRQVRDALQRSYRIWCKSSEVSFEAKKAAKSLRFVLEKAGEVVQREMTSEHSPTSYAAVSDYGEIPDLGASDVSTTVNTQEFRFEPDVSPEDFSAFMDLNNDVTMLSNAKFLTLDDWGFISSTQ